MPKLLLHELCPELSVEEIRRIAQECGFSKRNEKKFHQKIMPRISAKNQLMVLSVITI